MVLSHTLSPFGKKRERFFLQAKGTPVQGSPHCLADGQWAVLISWSITVLDKVPIIT